MSLLTHQYNPSHTQMEGEIALLTEGGMDGGVGERSVCVSVCMCVCLKREFRKMEERL